LDRDRRPGQDPGNRGELTAFPLSGKPERYRALEEVFLFGSGARYEVESTWFHNGTLVFKFRGVDTIPPPNFSPARKFECLSASALRSKKASSSRTIC